MSISLVFHCIWFWPTQPRSILALWS